MGHRQWYGPEAPVQDARLDPRVFVVFDRVTHIGSGSGVYGKPLWVDEGAGAATSSRRPVTGPGFDGPAGLLRRLGRGMHGLGQGLIRFARGLHVLAAGLELLERGLGAMFRLVAGIPGKTVAVVAFVAKRTWAKKGA